MRARELGASWQLAMEMLVGPRKPEALISNGGRHCQCNVAIGRVAVVVLGFH